MVVRLASCILIGAFAAAAGRLVLPASGLRGHYYTNLTRSGPPVAVSIDRALSTDTLDNGTAGVWTAFSVEWTGFLVVDTAGMYEFAVTSDDGSELEVDERVIVSNGGVHGATEARGKIALTAGMHPIRLRYEQAGGAFALEVKCSRDGARLMPLAPAMLVPDPIAYRAYRLRRLIPPALGFAAALAWWFVMRRRNQTASEPAAAATRAIDRPRVAVAIVVAVGVLARLVMMFGSNAILWGDSDVFLSTVDAIRAGRYLEHDPFRTLLYPYFLAPFLAFSNEPPMDQVIVGAQHLLGVAASVCFYLAGRAAFGSRAALAGALLFTVHTTELFYEASILSETFFVFLLAACLIPIVRFVSRPSYAGAMITGLACAALTLTRPVAEWFFLVPAAVAAVGTSSRRARVMVPLAVAATFAVAMLPWVIVNEQQFGFFGVAIGRGFGLYIRVFEIDGFDPPADTRYPEPRDVLMRARETHQYSPATYVRDWLGDRRKYSTIQKDELMARAALEAMREHPVLFARNSLRQWGKQLSGPLGDEGICHGPEGAYLCSVRTIGYAREPFLNRPRRAHEPVRPWVVAYFQRWRLPMTIVSGLAAFGVIAALADRRRQTAAAVLVALVIAYFTFLPAFAQSPQDRYRLPVDALLFMFAATGAAQLVRLVPRPHRQAGSASA